MLSTVALPGWSQAVKFEEDALGRGYVTRPYLRYEAEQGRCESEGVKFIDTRNDYNQENLASEASFMECAELGARGSSVSWTLDKDADALTIRFSLPDSSDGKGTKQTVGILSDGVKVTDVELDSYWAWQYTVKANVGEKYPDNTPADNKFARMRFDEANVLLPKTLKAGSKLTIVKENDAADAVTIDFVEAEMAQHYAKTDYSGDVVVYEGDGSTLQSFVNQNAGKTIYIPEGTYTIPVWLEIRNANTHIVGAGMWHTILMFSANPDNNRTYMRRGVRCSVNKVSIENLTLNTLCNKRYFENKSSQQMGKGLSGSWGTNSVIRNVRADHFECGAWIADYDGNSTRGLLVEGCRFRNNYADGINLCSGTQSVTVRNCSFRNNGDDDMASWSTGNEARNNTFENCTAENNWRASSLGIFGGRNHKALNIAIYDGMECGARINADFDGTGFSTQDEILFKGITIRRCGARSGGPCGTQGDFWGNANPSLNISAGYFYDLNNIRLEDILIAESRYDGVRLQSSSGKKINNITMRNITVCDQHNDGWPFNFKQGLQGNGKGINLRTENCGEYEFSPIPSGFDFTITDNDDSGIALPDAVGQLTVTGRCVSLASGAADADLYDISGTRVATLRAGESYTAPRPTLLIVRMEGHKATKISLR